MTTTSNTQFNLTREQFLDRVKNPNNYPQEKTKNSPAFNYLNKLLNVLNGKLKILIEPDYSKQDWNSEYRVSIKNPGEGEPKKSPEGIEIAVLDLAGASCSLSIMDIAEEAATQIEGLLILKLDEVAGIEDTPEYQEVSQYISNLRELI